MNKNKKLKNFYSQKNQIQSICEIAMISALWIALSYFSLRFRPLVFNGLFPIFYVLVWISGMFFSPKKAFITSFLGHFLFDIVIIFDIFFLFIWIASGLSSFFISLFKKYNWALIFIAFLFMPLFYFGAFSVKGLIIYNSPIIYFFVNPTVTFALIFLNPVFNLMILHYFVKPNFSWKKVNRIMGIYW